ncbi:MAG: hypothetical protein EOS30_11085 [Mesorhizobium sp.]|nr:hypothetical protein EN746_06110 [Mesorhizobium sp. M8A.F.Ca.ET.023.02.2.1]RWC75326.1 MAG: hypothetical protein EOS30_11085 [Mesorhizobium sp.]
MKLISRLARLKVEALCSKYKPQSSLRTDGTSRSANILSSGSDPPMTKMVKSKRSSSKPLPTASSIRKASYQEIAAMHHNQNSLPLDRSGSDQSIIALLSRQDSAQVLSIWTNDRICEYLLASDTRRHTWHAWLAANGNFISDAVETYRFLTFAKSRQILTDAFDSCPAGMISTLGKLGPYARPRPIYVAIHQALMAAGPLANHLYQATEFRDDDILSLASASTMPVSNRVLRSLLKCKIPAPELVELLWVIARLSPMHDEQRLVRAIVQGRQPPAILANLFSLMPFPNPPFEQVGALAPITTAEQLRKAGHEFDNCLKGGEELAYALASIQSAQRYFYRWDGEHPTLLAFCRCGSTGWILAERSGPANARVSQVTVNQIGEVLSGIPNVLVGKRGAGMLEWICAR